MIYNIDCRVVVALIEKHAKKIMSKIKVMDQNLGVNFNSVVVKLKLVGFEVQREKERLKTW